MSYYQLSFVLFQTIKHPVSLCTTSLLCFFLSSCLLWSHSLRTVPKFTFPLCCYGFSPSHHSLSKYPECASPLVGVGVYFRRNITCDNYYLVMLHSFRLEVVLAQLLNSTLWYRKNCKRQTYKYGGEMLWKSLRAMVGSFNWFKFSDGSKM